MQYLKFFPLNERESSITVIHKSRSKTTKDYNPYRPYSKKYQWIYEYRHTNGELFSATAPTLELWRQWRDEWLAEKSNNKQ